MQNDAVRKTNTTASQQITAKEEFVENSESNPLNSYRSYTYNFTLAALKNRGKIDPSEYVENRDYFVIARSGGKGTGGVQLDLLPDRVAATNAFTRAGQGLIVNYEKLTVTGKVREAIDSSLVNSFNAKSSGRFDFYLEDVVIDSIVSGSNKTNMSIATNIEFIVREQLSMAGFIEALHVTSIAAGYKSYLGSPFLLKMEFIGYPDDDLMGPAQIVENSTRYFVMVFTEINSEVTEKGTKYRCFATPLNEMVYGEPSVLKTDLNASGSTVKDILGSLIDNLNISIRKEAEKEKNPADRDKYDEYQIVFPSITPDGIDEATVNRIADATVADLLYSSSVYQFPELPDIITGTATQGMLDTASVKVSQLKAEIPFRQGSSIIDCVSSIIRDSEYTKGIFKNFKDSVDANGNVSYFMVHAESEIKGDYDRTRNRFYYRYKFIVVEYKMNYKRITPRPQETLDDTAIKKLIHRKYSFFYSGENTDIIRFRLIFNSLFFQSYPRYMGNFTYAPINTAGLLTDISDVILNRATQESSINGDAPLYPTVESSRASPGGLVSGVGMQGDPYSALARSLHQNILENIDQSQIEIDIIGDPYFLTSSAMGQQRLVSNPDFTTGLKEAPVYTQDVVILAQFKNPIDIDPETGMAIFDDQFALYSGLFRILEINSRFESGVFSQNLKLIRYPGQYADTRQLPQELKSPITSVANPSKESVPAAIPAPVGSRATQQGLAASIAAGLPVLGLPGDLSNLIPGSNIPISGPGSSVFTSGENITGAASSGIGSVINRVIGGNSQGLRNVDSLLRLSQSGLLPYSPTSNTFGADVFQVSNVLNSTGISNINIGSLAQNLSSQLGQTIDEQALSSIISLGNNSSGVVSGAASKISELTGNSNAISAQLGIEESVLSGLSPTLRTKLTEKISAAASKVPTNVDLTRASQQGLLLKNISISDLPNIPATQSKNISTAVSSVAARSANQLDVLSNSQKALVVYDKITSTLKTTSANETKLNRVSEFIAAEVPNTSNVGSSVVERYGRTETRVSPLDSLIRRRT